MNYEYGDQKGRNTQNDLITFDQMEKKQNSTMNRSSQQVRSGTESATATPNEPYSQQNSQYLAQDSVTGESNPVDEYSVQNVERKKQSGSNNPSQKSLSFQDLQVVNSVDLQGQKQKKSIVNYQRLDLYRLATSQNMTPTVTPPLSHRKLQANITVQMMKNTSYPGAQYQEHFMNKGTLEYSGRQNLTQNQFGAMKSKQLFNSDLRHMEDLKKGKKLRQMTHSYDDNTMDNSTLKFSNQQNITFSTKFPTVYDDNEDYTPIAHGRLQEDPHYINTCKVRNFSFDQNTNLNYCTQNKQKQSQHQQRPQTEFQMIRKQGGKFMYPVHKSKAQVLRIKDELKILKQDNRIQKALNSYTKTQSVEKLFDSQSNQKGIKLKPIGNISDRKNFNPYENLASICNTSRVSEFDQNDTFNCSVNKTFHTTRGQNSAKEHTQSHFGQVQTARETKRRGSLPKIGESTQVQSVFQSSSMVSTYRQSGNIANYIKGSKYQYQIQTGSSNANQTEVTNSPNFKKEKLSREEKMESLLDPSTSRQEETVVKNTQQIMNQHPYAPSAIKQISIVLKQKSNSKIKEHSAESGNPVPPWHVGKYLNLKQDNHKRSESTFKPKSVFVADPYGYARSLSKKRQSENLQNHRVSAIQMPNKPWSIPSSIQAKLIERDAKNAETSQVKVIDICKHTHKMKYITEFSGMKAVNKNANLMSAINQKSLSPVRKQIINELGEEKCEEKQGFGHHHQHDNQVINENISFEEKLVNKAAIVQFAQKSKIQRMFENEKLNQDQIRRFWDKTFKNQVQKYFQKVEDNNCFKGKSEDTNLLIRRLEKAFGPFKNENEIKRLISISDSSFLKFIEDHYKDEFLKNIDQFQNMSFDEYDSRYKSIPVGKNPKLSRAAQIIDNAKEDTMIPKFEINLFQIGMKPSDFIESFKVSCGIEPIIDQSNNDEVVVNLCHEFSISPNQLCFLLNSKLSQIELDKSQKLFSDHMKDWSNSKANGIISITDLESKDKIDNIHNEQSKKVWKRMNKIEKKVSGIVEPSIDIITTPIPKIQKLKWHKQQLKSERDSQFNEKFLVFAQNIEDKYSQGKIALDAYQDKVENFHLYACKAEEIMDTVIDEANTASVTLSEVYEKAINSLVKQRQMMQIQQVVRETLQILDDKAVQKSQDIFKSQKTLGSQQLIQQFCFGNKRDFLVKKFVRNLKQKVKQSKEKLTIKQHDILVQNLVTLKAYQHNFQEATLKNAGKNKNKTFTEIEQKILMSKLSEKLQGMFVRQKANETHYLEENVGKQSILQKLESQFRKNQDEPFSQNLVQKEIVQKYISTSIKSDSNPLPILNRIDQNKILYIHGYQINAGNAKSLAESLEKIVPKYLRKLNLIENNMSDSDLALLFQHLTLNAFGGLDSICIIFNDIGQKTLDSAQQFFAQADGARFLKGFHLKNPNPSPVIQPKFLNMLASIAENSVRLVNLSKLTISEFMLDKGCIDTLIVCILRLNNLHYLDISSNKISAVNMTHLLTQINKKNQIQTLRIGYNSASFPIGDEEEQLEIDPFTDILSKFIHKSDALIHLDLSGFEFKLDQLQYILSNGLRKSRTLLSCHINGLNTYHSMLPELKQFLKIKPVEQHPIFINGIDKGELQKVFKENSIFETKDEIVAYKIEKGETKMKQLKKKHLLNPSIKFNEDDRIVFERVLGHSEIVKSHQWRQSTEKKCRVCANQCYAVFIWNQEVQKSHLGNQYYNSSKHEPLNLNSKFLLKQPVIMINGQCHQMLTTTEFVERQKASLRTGDNLHIRPCIDQKEKLASKLLRKRIKEDLVDDLILDPSYWKHSQYIIRQGNLQDEQSEEEFDSHCSKIDDSSHDDCSGAVQNINSGLKMGFASMFKSSSLQYKQYLSDLINLIPRGAYEGVNIETYTKTIVEVFEEKFIRNQHYFDAEAPKESERVNLAAYLLYKKAQERQVKLQRLSDTEMSDTLSQGMKYVAFRDEKQRFIKMAIDTAAKMERQEFNMWQAINEQTYITAVFLPCQHSEFAKDSISGNQIETIIKCPTQSGVSYLTVPQVPFNNDFKKNRVYYKQIKKVKVGRTFNRQSSIFSQFGDENVNTVRRGLDHDMHSINLNDLIKLEGNDRTTIVMLFRQHYPSLKDQFLKLIIGHHSYPKIAQCEFLQACKQWKLYDEFLTPEVVTELFDKQVKDNHEEEDGCNSKCLARHQFLELFVRMAKQKYIARKSGDSIGVATERLLLEFILPNKTEKLSIQQFREEHLWNLEVDDLFQANKEAIVELYVKCKSFGKNKTCFQIEDATQLLKEMGYIGNDNYYKASLAYAFCKQFNEKNDPKIYQDMRVFEFYEFLGRLAFLLYPSSTTKPLVKKIQMLLQVLLEKMVDRELIVPDHDGDADSESDYEDDIVETIVDEIQSNM